MQKCINQLDQTVENGATNSKIISLIPRECMNWEKRKGIILSIMKITLNKSICQLNVN